MGEFGWAYISGSVSGEGAAKSVQFIETLNGPLTGSESFTFDRSTSVLELSGTMKISGTIQAHTFDVIQTNKIEISSSGGTNFGNNCEDNHILTGSLIMASGAIKQYYKKVTAASYTVASCDSIVGISSSAYVSITLPSASAQGAGRILTIKDEYYVTRTLAGNTHIALTASGADKIDHQANYVIEGDSVALTLYSDGAGKWFIY